MENIYNNINTFSDEIYKSDLREKILNPLIVQHNHMSLDITNLDTRVETLEAGGGNGGSGITRFEDLIDVPAFEAEKFLKVNTSGDLEWAEAGTGAEPGEPGASTFVELTDTPAEYTGMKGKVLKVNEDETALIFAEDNVGGGEGGATSFVELSDTPATLSADKYVKVNAGGTALEFVDAPTGGDGSVDLGPLTTRVADVESDVEGHETRLASAETKITALENNPGGGGEGSTTFLGLTDTPASYTNAAGKGVKVNTAGDALEFFLIPQIDENGLGHGKDVKFCMCPIGREYTQAQVQEYCAIIGASGETNTVALPEIVDAGQVGDSTTKVEGGRIVYITSLEPTMTVTPHGNNKIWYNGRANDNLVLKPGQGVQLLAIKNGSVFVHWVVVGGADVVDPRMAEFESRIAALEAAIETPAL